MKYVYVEYALIDGWDCKGIFLKEVVDKAPVKKLSRKISAVILDMNDMVVVTGRDSIIDSKSLIKECELLNK